jgi:hypothetical protein
MQKAQIVTLDVGRHNADIKAATERLSKSRTYQNLSTIIVCPTRGVIPAKVVQSWMSLGKPMNQAVVGPLFAIGMEVGDAYNQTIKSIIDNPGFNDFKYILTIEEDNIPPADGLMKLYENIEEYDVVGGLYWTKGEEGQPMIYGNPNVIPKNFIPQVPIPESIQPCNGMGMGFHLFKLDIFRKMPYPWFKTVQDYQAGKVYTQDLFFYEEAAKYGYKFACDTRCKIGHLDYINDIIW